MTNRQIASVLAVCLGVTPVLSTACSSSSPPGAARENAIAPESLDAASSDDAGASDDTIVASTATLSVDDEGNVTTTVQTMAGELVTIAYTALQEDNTASAQLTFEGIAYQFTAVPAPSDATSGAIVASILLNAVNPRNPGSPQNHAGCDVIGSITLPGQPSISCGGKGGCCDAHDQCINDNSCQGFCGTPAALLFPGCSRACQLCQTVVVSCFINPHNNPGPSGCCTNWGRGSSVCGMQQQCVYNDGSGQYVVETNPCVCQQLGIPSATPCKAAAPIAVPTSTTAN